MAMDINHINGLNEAAEDTQKYTNGAYGDQYVQISFNRETNTAITAQHCSIGHGDRLQYGNPNIITICFASCPMTAQQIARRIYEELSAIDQYVRIPSGQQI